MKNGIYSSLLIIVFTLSTLLTSAQQVNTLYFMDNAPVRHYINPAFNPISNFYLSLPVIGYTNLSLGNNSFSLDKMLWQGQDGRYKTYLHPEADHDKFINSLRRTTLFNMDMQTNIFSFGFRAKDKNYIHITVNEKFDGGIAVPRDFFSMFLNGFMTPDGNGHYRGNYDLHSFSESFSAYTEIGFGYTRTVNNKWSVGFKLKALFGLAYFGNSFSKFKLDLTEDRWNFDMKGDLAMSVMALEQLFPQGYPDLTPDYINNLIENGADGIINTDIFNDFGRMDVKDYLKLLRPAGIGAGLDFGITYKPIKQLQISAAITDLGFIRWRGPKYNVALNNIGFDASTIDIDLSDYYDKETSSFNGQALLDTMLNMSSNILNKIEQDAPASKFWKMTSASINIGLDANFWDNRIGLGVYSRSRLYNGQFYEEVTIGAAFRPVHWFNLAASYSFINGNWGTLGLGLGLVTYEGLGLFIAADYIPVSYASLSRNNEHLGKLNDIIPYKTSNFNLALGFNIVIGHRSQRDKDHDGVYDKYDLCPDTPRNVPVDKNGCPIDTDGDDAQD